MNGHTTFPTMTTKQQQTTTPAKRQTTIQHAPVYVILVAAELAVVAANR